MKSESSSEWTPEELATLRQLKPFSDLADQTEECWIKRTAGPGDTIVESSDLAENLYVILEGEVRIFGGPTLRGSIKDAQCPVLGIPNVLLGIPFEFDALSACDCVYACMPAAIFIKLLDTDKQLADKLRQEVTGALARKSDSSPMIREPFKFLNEWHDTKPWGNVLDAGTGYSSLSWILDLPTESWTAVTGDASRMEGLQNRFGEKFRKQDRLIEQNWTDESLLNGEQFDVVLADYLLGAIEKFAPYFQQQLWTRLRPHVGGYLYITGREPFDLTPAKSAESKVIKSVMRIRDALFLMTNQPRFREYPLTWVLNSLASSGFVVETTEAIPKRFSGSEIDLILDDCLRLLPELPNPELAFAYADLIGQQRKKAVSLPLSHMEIPFGSDYVVIARPVN